MPSRPGLAKVRRPPHVTTKLKSFVRTFDGAIRDWLELADIVSEGALRAGVDGQRASYFGSTSIILEWSRSLSGVRPEDVDVMRALTRDPHLRVRALRLARREAEVRAGSELSVVRADFDARATLRGVVLTIDVEALTIAHAGGPASTSRARTLAKISRR